MIGRLDTDIEQMQITRDPDVTRWIDELLAQNRIILDANQKLLKHIAAAPIIFRLGKNSP